MTDVNKNRRLKPRRRASPSAGLRSGITRRWARGSLLVIVLLLAVIEGMFLYSTIQGYYDGVQQSMYRRFSSINGQLKVYSSGTVQRTAAAAALPAPDGGAVLGDKWSSALRDAVPTRSGIIIVSASFEQAQTAADGYGTAVYTTKPFSVCCCWPAAEEIVAMRLVTRAAASRRSPCCWAWWRGRWPWAGRLLLYFVRSIVVPQVEFQRAELSAAAPPCPGEGRLGRATGTSTVDVNAACG